MFLREIVDRLGDVDPASVISPNDEVKKGEEAVGMAPDDVRRLWSLRNEMGEAAERARKNVLHIIADEADEDNPSPRLREVVAECKLLLEKMRVLNALVWTEIQCAFPETAGRGIALRKNWQVVTCDRSEDVSGVAALMLLRALFGA